MKKLITTLTLMALTSLSLSAQSLTANFSTHVNETCAGSCDGSLDLSVSGGTGGPYTYFWQPGGQTSSSISGLCAGTYSCTVTDGVNSVLVQDTISAPSPLIITMNHTENSCMGDSVSLCPMVSGGQSAYFYNWSPSFGIAAPTAACTMAGPTATTTYTFTVVDMAGCMAMDMLTINVHPYPVINSIVAAEASCGGSDGVLTANVNTPVFYSWQPLGSTSAQASGLSSATYTLYVVDSIGCTTNMTYFLADSCDLVWPGDVNDDLVTDNLDLLDLAVMNGNNGHNRSSNAISWTGFPSRNWGIAQAGGADAKHADCNGNGIIDLSDTTVVIQNFNLNRPASRLNMVSTASGLPLVLQLAEDTLAAGMAGHGSVYLGDAANPVSNVYGVAFTISFDPAIIDPSSFVINANGGWLGNQATDMFAIIMNDGVSGIAQAALARFDHANVSGSGLLANVSFTTRTDYMGDQLVSVGLNTGVLVDKDKNLYPVIETGDSLFAQEAITLGNTDQDNSVFACFPNPVNSGTPFVISGVKGSVLFNLFDCTGRSVSKTVVSQGSSTVSTNQLPAGTYFYSIAPLDFEGGTLKGKLIIR